MKNIQKLEIGSGIATLIASSIYICISILPNIDLRNEGQTYTELFSKIFLLIIFPSLLTAIGSYIHSIKQSKTGLIALLLGGSFLILFFGLFFMLAKFYYHGLSNGWFAIIPGVFATLTIYFALRSRKFFASQLT